jgi:hypothetical protein
MFGTTPFAIVLTNNVQTHPQLPTFAFATHPSSSHDHAKANMEPHPSNMKSQKTNLDCPSLQGHKIREPFATLCLSLCKVGTD